jgi:hypothetical protein
VKDEQVNVHPSSLGDDSPLAAEVDPRRFPTGEVAFRQLAHGVGGPVRFAVGHMGRVMNRPQERGRARIGRAPFPVGGLHTETPFGEKTFKAAASDRPPGSAGPRVEIGTNPGSIPLIFTLGSTACHLGVRFRLSRKCYGFEDIGKAIAIPTVS